MTPEGLQSGGWEEHLSRAAGPKLQMCDMNDLSAHLIRMYIYVYIHMYVYIYIHTYVYIYMYLCIPIYKYLWMVVISTDLQLSKEISLDVCYMCMK